jgi:IclR family acetate operon transcriptional repressor
MSSIRSVRRAFDVLAALADGPHGVTVVAQRARLPKSTTARVLATLVAEGAVEQIPGDVRYRLGPRMVALAAGARTTRSLIAIARPYLAELSAAVGEAAGLSVPEGTLVHYVDQVDSPHPVGVRDWTGTRIPMHAVSSGQVFLALRSPAELDAYLERRLEPFTSRTVVHSAALRGRIRQVQLDGFAWTIEEYAEGIASVAAPVVDEEGEVVAAVHVHGPSYRFPAAGSETDVAAQVVGTAGRISERIRD